VRGPIDGPVPVSFAQQGQWFLWQLNPANTAYHVGGGLGFSGALDVAALQDAMQAIARRHEALRTVFGPSPKACPSSASWRKFASTFPSSISACSMPLRASPATTKRWRRFAALPSI
jgi:hypothetical protein